MKGNQIAFLYIKKEPPKIYDIFKPTHEILVIIANVTSRQIYDRSLRSSHTYSLDVDEDSGQTLGI